MQSVPNTAQQALAASQEFLRKRLSLFLERLPEVLRPDVTLALSGKGKLLAPSSSPVEGERSVFAGVWALLPFLVARHIEPALNENWASAAALAVECFLCALDLLDDVEDDDQTHTLTTLGVARTLNVSTTLLMLAQQILLMARNEGMPLERLMLLTKALQAAALTATGGQHQDLLAEHQPIHELTRDDCLAIARAKAGSLMGLACRLGALCAGAPEDLCERFGEFGTLLGLAHQLDNDSHDLAASLRPADSLTAPGGEKTDRLRQKKTLPLVLSAQMQPSSPSPGSAQLYIGITVTWGISLLYRQRAQNSFSALEEELQPSPPLRLLLGFPLT